MLLSPWGAFGVCVCGMVHEGVFISQGVHALTENTDDEWLNCNVLHQANRQVVGTWKQPHLSISPLCPARRAAKSNAKIRSQGSPRSAEICGHRRIDSRLQQSTGHQECHVPNAWSRSLGREAHTNRLGGIQHVIHTRPCSRWPLTTAQLFLAHGTANTCKPLELS